MKGLRSESLRGRMKKGANKSDINNIKAWYESGATPEAISQALLIDVDVIKRFKPDNVKETAKASKAKAKQLDEEHKEVMENKKSKSGG